jgi:hypothetical protein
VVPATRGSKGRGPQPKTVSGQKNVRPYLKKPKAKRAGGMAQMGVVEHLPRQV